jgi:aspartyl-tRNA(Asn)/glutamyl-tRNA(Gln) amidotransferase subunit B
VTPEKMAAVKAALGELPAAMRIRLESSYEISAYDSDVIVNQGREFVAYFAQLADLTKKSGAKDGKVAANWISQDVLRILNEQGKTIAEFPIAAAELASLIARVSAGDFNTSRAREVFAEMLTGKSAAEAVAALGITKIDESELFSLAEEILKANPKIVADIKAGKAQAAGNLIGQAKKRNPNVNPARFKEICLELAGKMG